jgi:type II secretory pathway pseudopilin PulG
MAVIAILAAAVLPGAIDLIRTQRIVKEGAVLPKIAEALKRGMLREQIFPVNENDAGELTEGNEAYWWNLAARHGGGSANELRYPLDIRPGSTTTRKLYFAEQTWSGKSFLEVTDDGLDWLNNFQDPTELRLLLISTTNPDLLLPDTLNEPRFNKFWEDWAVGSDGDPASGAWSNYGFSSSKWQGRAAELNVQRIDLRDWLCTVVIENRRAIKAEPPMTLNELALVLPEPSVTLASVPNNVTHTGFWDRGTVSLSSTNLQDTEFIIQARDTYEDTNGNDPYGRTFKDYRSEDLNGNGVFNDGVNSPFLNEVVDGIDYNRDGDKLDNDISEDLDGNGIFDHPAQIYTFVEAVIQTQRGRRIDVSQDATVTISGRRSFDSLPEQSITATLTLTNRAPLALLNPDAPSAPVALTKWTNADPYIQNRYFLKTQELLLGEPWTFAEVGIFSITEAFSTLRFDGLQWHY